MPRALLRFLDDPNEAPSLVLGKRARLHDLDGIAFAAGARFVMRLEPVLRFMNLP